MITENKNENGLTIFEYHILLWSRRGPNRISAVKVKNRKMLDREDAEQVDACTMQD